MSMKLFDAQKASDLMRSHGIDVMIANSLLNAGYLADHWKHEMVSSFGSYMTDDDGVPYQFFVGLPCDRKIDPFVTCRTGGEESDMAYTNVWIQDKRFWGPMNANRAAHSPFGLQGSVHKGPVEAVVRALHDRGLEIGTIGVEMHFLGAGLYEQLRLGLPDAKFMDGTMVLDQLRSVKSDEEVRRMRIVAKATEQAIESAFQSVNVGTTGLDLEKVIGASHYLSGVHHEWCHTCIGPQGALISCPNTIAVCHGQIVRLDVGASFNHYQCDISRVAVLGEPSRTLCSVHGAMRKGLEAVLEVVRPGKTVGHLFDVGNGVIEAEGFQNYLTTIGHGVGRDIHELPFLKKGDPTVLKEGMALAVEFVTMHKDLGCVAVEDNIVVTADGHEALSKTGRDLYVIG